MWLDMSPFASLGLDLMPFMGYTLVFFNLAQLPGKTFEWNLVKTQILTCVFQLRNRYKPPPMPSQREKVASGLIACHRRNMLLFS